MASLPRSHSQFPDYITVNTTSNTVNIVSTTTSVSNTTGALVVKGGAAVAGNTTVGTISTVGGITGGSRGDTNWAGSINGNLYYSHAAWFDRTGSTQIYINHASSGWGTIGNPSANTFGLGTTNPSSYALLWGTANNYSVNWVSIPATSNLMVLNTASSLSNTTGAVVISGGVGIQGNVFTGNIRVTGAASNGITFVDGTTQVTSPAATASYANSAYIQANAAFSAANTKLPRIVTIADGTTLTVNTDTTDLAIQTNTQVAGTLTIAAPTGTPTNGQKFMIRVQCTNVQTLSFNAIFTGSSDMSLPTATTGTSKYDYMGFIYNTTAVKWQLLGKNFGF